MPPRTLETGWRRHAHDCAYEEGHFKDVARALGVSQSTVSRAFSADARIPEETRERILKSAQALGYTPNELARGLLKSKSNIVGVVMADMLNPFYPNVLDIMSRRLHAIGKRMLLFSVPNDTDVDEVLPFLLQYNVEGVIITSATLSSKMADVFRNHNTRVVLFNRAVYDRSVSSVCCRESRRLRQCRPALDRGRAPALRHHRRQARHLDPYRAQRRLPARAASRRPVAAGGGVRRQHL